MEFCRKHLWISLILVVIYSSKGIQNVQAAPALESFDISKRDSERLISMGKILDKSERSLVAIIEEQEKKMSKTIIQEIKVETCIKKTIENEASIQEIREELQNISELLKYEICSLKACGQWTEWSTCSAERVKRFGVSFRSRTCGTDSKFCHNKFLEDLESESRICQGNQDISNCPETYTLTSNMFCIRVRSDVEKSWKRAQSKCKKDGGYLINIDSKLKSADVNITLETLSFPDYTYFWIDGQRPDSDTKWQYEYGSENIGLSSWYRDHPETPDKHIIYYKVRGNWTLFGVRNSKKKRHFICEII